MAAEPSLEQSLTTLSVGNIVTVGLQLFRNQGGRYFVTSLLAHIWLFLGIIGIAILLAIVGGITFAAVASQPSWEGVVLAVLLGLVLCSPLLAFLSGRFQASGGLITRQVFNRLLGHEEPQEQSRQQIYPRLWAFFWASMVSTIVLLLAYGGLGLIGYLLWLLFAPLFEAVSLDNSENLLLFVAVLIAYILLNFGLLLLAYYVTARLWFFDAVLAVEVDANPWQAVARSWQITHKQGVNVMIVLFIGSALSFPVAALTNVVNYVVPVASLLLGILFYPLWQAIKAIHYYELRSRNEGFAFDLERPLVRPRQWLRRVAIQTPEQIELDFALAGVGSRGFAWLVDVVVLGLGLFVLWYVGAAIYFYGVLPAVTEAFGSTVIDDLQLWVAAIAGLLTYILANGYHIACETFWQGQTPGKWLARIRVIQTDGRPVTLREASLRSLIGPIDLNLLFIGLALIIFGKSERRLGDLAAGTLVIQNEKRQVTQQGAVTLTFGRQAQVTAKTLHEQANLSALSADQYLILRNYLGYRVQLAPTMRKQLTVKLATQLQQILAPPETPSGLNIPEAELLEATYLACRATLYP